MKRFFIFLPILLLVAGFVFAYKTNLTSLVFDKHFYYAVNEENKLQVLTSNEANKQVVYNSLTSLLGEGGTTSLDKLEGIVDVLEAKQVKQYNIGEIVVKNYFSPRLSSYVIVNGDKVNLQVAIKENMIKVGHPLILDSF